MADLSWALLEQGFYVYYSKNEFSNPENTLKNGCAYGFERSIC
jgi:hypothetical protein